MPIAYASLNDAARLYRLPCLAPGRVKVWYLRPQVRWDERLTDIMFGQFERINPRALRETHILLGKIDGGDSLEEVFRLLKGDQWSPHGEAKGLIEALRLDHTDMRVGDLLETPSGIWVAAAFGFEQISGPVLAQVG